MVLKGSSDVEDSAMKGPAMRAVGEVVAMKGAVVIAAARTAGEGRRHRHDTCNGHSWLSNCLRTTKSILGKTGHLGTHWCRQRKADPGAKPREALEYQATVLA